MTEKEVRDTIENNLYEEYPVVDGDLDHVVGILRLKDFVVSVGKENFNLSSMVQEPTYFHENMNVYKVLEEMKKKKISRALVCDEFGSCSGIITLKDILEALIGNINDDQQEPDIIVRPDNDGYLVDGQCTMYDFLRYFDLDDSMEDFEYSTVAGLILDELEHMPVEGDKIEWNKFSLEVVDMDGPRIDKIIVKINEEPVSDEENEL
jgi:putative hemolysin